MREEAKSDAVSSLRDPSLCYSAAQEDTLPQDAEMEVVARLEELNVDKKKPVLQVQTRHRQRAAEQKPPAQMLEDAETRAKFESFAEFSAQSEALLKESFYGVFHLLRRKDPQQLRPVLLIVRNVKGFPAGVLNDLVHLLKKYRAAPFGAKLNLLVGVQSNSKDEFHLRVRVQNSVKLTVKTFYFPSMKNIIFEVVYRLLLDPHIALTLEDEVVRQLVETANLFGLSVLKFKRLLKLLLAEFFLRNDLFFVHQSLSLCKRRRWAERAPEFTRAVQHSIEKHYRNPEVLEQIAQALHLPLMKE